MFLFTKSSTLDILNHPRVHRLLEPVPRIRVKSLCGIALRTPFAVVGIRLLQRLR